MTPDTLQRVRALIEGRDGILLIETGSAGSLNTGKLNRGANIISGCTLITRNSVNGGRGGRKYSDQALQQIASMAEGLPAYVNHVKPEDAFKARDVKDLIGKHMNVRYDAATGRVTSDLHLLDHQAPWVFSLAERMGDQVGNSLVSKGLVRMEGDTEVVDSIAACRSGDLVSDPASTRGLFESLIEARHAPLSMPSLTDVLDRVRGVTRVPPGTHERLAEALTRPGRSAPSSSSGADLHSRLRQALVRP
jgi:hypothetical protein